MLQMEAHHVTNGGVSVVEWKGLKEMCSRLHRSIPSAHIQTNATR